MVTHSAEYRERFAILIHFNLVITSNELTFGEKLYVQKKHRYVFQHAVKYPESCDISTKRKCKTTTIKDISNLHRRVTLQMSCQIKMHNQCYVAQLKVKLSINLK